MNDGTTTLLLLKQFLWLRQNYNSKTGIYISVWDYGLINGIYVWTPEKAFLKLCINGKVTKLVLHVHVHNICVRLYLDITNDNVHVHSLKQLCI